MFTFLRALDLQPIEWDQAVGMTGKGTPYIGEVLDVAFERGQAVVVLMTPDDIAYLQPTFADGEHDPEATPRARPAPMCFSKPVGQWGETQIGRSLWNWVSCGPLAM